MGMLDEHQLVAGLECRAKDDTSALGEFLIQMGYLTPAQLMVALARKQAYPLVDPMRFEVSPAAMQRLPFALAREHGVLPLSMHGDVLVLASVSPVTQIYETDDIEAAARCRVRLALSAVSDMASAISAQYQALGLLEQG